MDCLLTNPMPNDSLMDAAMKYREGITFLILILCLSVMTAQASSKEDVFKYHGVPAFEPAKYLCGGRAYGSGVEIHWDALTSTVPPEKAAVFYTEALQSSPLLKDNSWTWTLPDRADHGTTTLVVVPVSEDGPWRRCGTAVDPDTRSVILLSIKIRQR